MSFQDFMYTIAAFLTTYMGLKTGYGCAFCILFFYRTEPCKPNVLCLENRKTRICKAAV